MNENKTQEILSNTQNREGFTADIHTWVDALFMSEDKAAIYAMAEHCILDGTATEAFKLAFPRKMENSPCATIISSFLSEGSKKVLSEVAKEGTM